MNKPAKTDLYQEVTNTIIAALEKGAGSVVLPWNKTNHTGALPLRCNGQPYQGVNVVLLWASQQENEFTSNQWFTFKQAEALGAQVRKGEKASQVVFTDAIHTTKPDKTGTDQDVSIPFLKRYFVFNANQIDGLPVTEDQALAQSITQSQRIAALDTFFASTGADVREGGNQAFYTPSRDFIAMPNLVQFPIVEHFYGVLSHELTHWTGHESRCNREFSKRFGDAQCAAEELVAELGAAFLCAGLGIEAKTMEGHVNYLANWLKLLKDDKKAIFTAASAAQKAVNFIHDVVAQHEPMKYAA
jgi:antirestriction protein ArdC